MTFERVLQVLFAGMLFILLPLSVEANSAEVDNALVPIRIGWQIPAATQAHIAQVLKRTDVLERHGLEPSLVPFSYGGPQINAALDGDLDVIFAGDQPAINLIARGGKWKIVARLFYDRIAFIVPRNSPIQTIDDLKGKTVASPFGSTGHRVAFLQQQRAGLDAEKDVTNKNLDILEIRRRVLDGGVKRWGELDAAVVWEPTLSRFELDGLARILTEERTLGVVAVSDDFIADHPEATVQFLVSVVRAWDYFARHPDSVMQWYNDDAQLGYARETLLSAARLDPNFTAKSLHEIDLNLTEEHIAIIEQGIEWRRKLGKDNPHKRQYVDHSVLADAKNIIAAAQFDDIQVILPSIRETQQIEIKSRYGPDAVPLWVVFAFMVLIALLAIEIGLWLGIRRQRKVAQEPVGPVATVVGAVLGMLAFVIALTFGTASNRFDDRKEALLDDVNSIQTAYLRTSLLPEPHRTTVRSLLRDYVQVRVGMVYAYGQPDILELIQRRAEALQESMWSHAEALAETEKNAPINALFASALNDLFDIHTKRVVLGAHYRIPGFVWWALIMASTVAMVAVGFQFGVGGRQRSITVNLALAVTFALVMLLVFDLDRAGEGLITVNQQPMIDLYQSMRK